MIRIPSKERKEWEQLVTGNLEVTLTNFFLRTKVNQIKEDTTKMALTVDEAVKTVYDMCLELRETRDISADIKAIFGNVEEVIESPESQTFDLSFLDKKMPPLMVDNEAISHQKVPETAKQPTTVNSSFSNETVEQKLKEKIKTVLQRETAIKKAAVDDISQKDDKLNKIDTERERLKKASIERRNQERKALLEKERNTSKGSFFKSLFNS